MIPGTLSPAFFTINRSKSSTASVIARVSRTVGSTVIAIDDHAASDSEAARQRLETARVRVCMADEGMLIGEASESRVLGDGVVKEGLPLANGDAGGNEDPDGGDDDN